MSIPNKIIFIFGVVTLIVATLLFLIGLVSARPMYNNEESFSGNLTYHINYTTINQGGGSMNYTNIAMINQSNTFTEEQIVDDSLKIIASGINFTKMNPPPAPTVALDAVSNVNGTFRYTVTFVTKWGETNGSELSSIITALNHSVLLTNVATGSEDVIARKIYRCDNNRFSCLYKLYIDTISNNVDTTYLDNTYPAPAETFANTLKDINTAGGVFYGMSKLDVGTSTQDPGTMSIYQGDLRTNEYPLNFKGPVNYSVGVDAYGAFEIYSNTFSSTLQLKSGNNDESGITFRGSGVRGYILSRNYHMKVVGNDLYGGGMISFYSNPYNNSCFIFGNTVISSAANCPARMVVYNGITGRDIVRWYSNTSALRMQATDNGRFYFNGSIGIGEPNPQFPLTVGNNSGVNTSSISIYSLGNISASGYITRTHTYDKSRGKALDFAKDSDYYKNPDGTINHKAFEYSYVNYTNWKLNNTVLDIQIVTECTDERPAEGIFEKVCGEKYVVVPRNVYIPFTEDAISLDKEIALLKQQVYELKTELCKTDKTYEFCGGTI